VTDQPQFLDLLRRAQEFVGTETSVEAQKPKATYDIYHEPISEGDRLRREAERADRRDQLIIEIRKALQ
jgi:hypothetical protein